nr:methyl-accepting chemotaxis protein [uncultured Desulfobacter sp.]
MKFSLKNKFIIPTVTTAVICLGAISLFSYLKASQALKNVISSEVKYVSSSISKQVSQWIFERESDISQLAQEDLFNKAISSLGPDEVKAADSRLNQIKKSSALFDNIHLAGPDGMVMASSDTGLVGSLNLSTREYFKDALTGTLSLSQVIKSKTTGQPVFCIAAPVRQGNKIHGVLVGVINMNHFTAQFIDTEKVGQNGYVYMVNKSGVVLAYPDKSKILSLDVSQYEFGRNLLSQQDGLMEYKFKGVDKIVGFAKEKTTNWIIASTADKSELFAPVIALRNISITIAIVSIILIGSIILLVTRSIVGPLNRIIEGMNEAGNQVAAASTQVAMASQSLAEGASEQAASVEETSASMEEMASMTQSMAGNANQADLLSKESHGIVTRANESMEALTRSMSDISTASEETSKIIKTIDEIAFQTNLLALNAAVEAARAGEAGAGFAVVADEVRNLAMRAAEAAKDTEKLIAGTMEKVSNGSALVATTNEAFVAVDLSTSKVGELVMEMSQASREQSAGISQVNVAIAEIDKVVQHNAANAEESASAAEEMNAQAEQLRDYVNDLHALITGEDTRLQTSHPSRQIMGRSSRGQKKIATSQAREIRSDQMLDFDEDGFKDFAA